MRSGRPPPAPDFPQVIRSLERQGMSRSGIARKMHISTSTICRWYTGTALPTYRLGAELLWLAGFDPPDAAKAPDTHEGGRSLNSTD